MTGPPQSTITLRALEGQPLVHDGIRSMVEATAHAIAERQGVRVVALRTEPDRITVTLAAGRIEAIGFAAELRRLTSSWYAHKFGVDSLWGDPPRDVDDADWWKQA
ncbi:MAG: hypothetical protein KDA25_08450 [Phycisphaerales bacterium]|nr:hypothetical protein [Phycisphaerales bacterium]